MNPTYTIADYDNPSHANAVVQLLDTFANDPMGGAEPLSHSTKNNLALSLAQFPGAFSVLAQVDDEFVGLANCFTGFSTFACKPLINIHDFFVTSSQRGQGIAAGLLARVEDEAHLRGCYKVTLEVLEGNSVARAFYAKSGFIEFTVNDQFGSGLCIQKVI